ncbi:hypothetical protein BDD12DRAFT_891049 [Trichophaea hybrida]|nr:hypothetical protein BDD12DRAFT_891049 [Trichophaea hybrida]
MVEITVGQVSGAINLAILIGQITFPLILVFVLARVLTESNTATTWSVVCRIVQSTWWSNLLSSDSATYKAVNQPVVALSVFSTVGMAILAIAGIITPLGLSDEIIEASVRNAQFDYIRDPGLFGLGTPAPDDYTLSRICGTWGPSPCSSQPWPKDFIINSTGAYTPSDDYILNVSTAIPKNLTDLFRSFTDLNRTTTVSGILDIQYRTYRKFYDKSSHAISSIIDGGKDYTVGLYRTYDMVINRDPYVLIDGLVVNGANGGVGSAIIPSLEDFHMEQHGKRTSCGSSQILGKTGRPINYAIPLWGVVDDRYENNADLPISTLRRPYLYLPVSSAFQTITLQSGDSIAASAAPQAVLDSVYRDVLMDGSSSEFKVYTGEQSFTTDLMANYVTGSKSVISSTDTGGQDSVSRSRLVRTYDRQIRYDFRYVIPTILFLTLWLFTSHFVMLSEKKSKLADVRQLVNHTATGRAIMTTAFPDMCEEHVSTKEWVRTAGKEMIIVKYKTQGKTLESSESASAPSTGWR